MYKANMFINTCQTIGIKYVLKNHFKAVKQQRTLKSRVSKSMFITCFPSNTCFGSLKVYYQVSRVTDC